MNELLLNSEERLRQARTLRRLARVSIVLAPTLVLWLIFGNVYIRHRTNLVPYNLVAAVLAIAAGAFGAWYYLENGALASIFIDKEPFANSVHQLQLELDLVKEKRRVQASTLELGIHDRRSSYRVTTGAEVEKLRVSSKRYRRWSNLLQAVVIVGSIAASTLAGLALDRAEVRWMTVGTTFLVGVSAGFLGFFKFRERSFYLQQTADAMEFETNAFELGIGSRYRGSDEKEALLCYVEEMERLRNEQRKREQNLDQPSEKAPDR